MSGSLSLSLSLPPPLTSLYNSVQTAECRVPFQLCIAHHCICNNRSVCSPFIDIYSYSSSFSPLMSPLPNCWWIEKELWFAFQITNKSPALLSLIFRCTMKNLFFFSLSCCIARVLGSAVYTYNRPNSYAPLYTERERERERPYVLNSSCPM